MALPYIILQESPRRSILRRLDAANEDDFPWDVQQCQIWFSTLDLSFHETTYIEFFEQGRTTRVEPEPL